MLHKAWNSKEEMPYCFPRSSIKFQGHTGQNITDFDPNWAFPDYRPVAAFKSLRFALLFIIYYFIHHLSITYYWTFQQKLCQNENFLVIIIFTVIFGYSQTNGYQCSGTVSIWKYHQISNMSRTLIGNKIVDHSDVVGAAPVGAAPTTSSFST